LERWPVALQVHIPRVLHPQQTAPQPHAAGLPLNFERHTDNLDAMVKRRNIRALVFYSRSSFFYVNGRPQGIYYEALRAFEQSVNQKLQTGKQPVQVTFIPVRPDQAERALTQGVGDLIAYGLTVTPERQQRVAFSVRSKQMRNKSWLRESRG
jgi:membrane-bound lytic murein transglycosylase MltF